MTTFDVARNERIEGYQETDLHDYFARVSKVQFAVEGKALDFIENRRRFIEKYHNGDFTASPAGSILWQSLSRTAGLLGAARTLAIDLDYGEDLTAFVETGSAAEMPQLPLPPQILDEIIDAEIS